MVENLEYKYSLQTPQYQYEMYNKTIKRLRDSINISNDQIQQFWEDHISYKFLKPKTIEDLIIWIKCMFFNKTFLEAYAKTSRTMMTMRISKFVKAKIIKETVKIKDYNVKIEELLLEAHTMKEYYNNLVNSISQFKNYQMTIIEEQLLVKILTKCDPTYSAIYSILTKIRIKGVKTEKNKDNSSCG